MRKLMLLTMLAVSGACAHHAGEQNLARRSEVSVPRNDFEGTPRDEARERAIQRVEKPLVTPPVP